MPSGETCYVKGCLELANNKCSSCERAYCEQHGTHSFCRSCSPIPQEDEQDEKKRALERIFGKPKNSKPKWL